jgi:hypothetical protein
MLEESMEIARQYLEKEKNGTLDLNNLTEDEQQMRMFSKAYDESGLGELFADAVVEAANGQCDNKRISQTVGVKLN